jgi:hypothetical protein
MGVKGLLKFIKEKEKEKNSKVKAIKNVNFKNYSGKIIAIDVNLLLKNFILEIKHKKKWKTYYE